MKPPKNVGFETLSEDENSLVIKRVLPRGSKKKDVIEIEMSLPKVTMHLFDEKDLEDLRKIEADILNTMRVTEKKYFAAAVRTLWNLLMK